MQAHTGDSVCEGGLALQVPSRAWGPRAPRWCHSAVLSCARPAAPVSEQAARLPLGLQRALPHPHSAAPGGVGGSARAAALPLALRRLGAGRCGSRALQELTAFPVSSSKAGTGAEMETASQQLRLKQGNECRNYVC